MPLLMCIPCPKSNTISSNDEMFLLLLTVLALAVLRYCLPKHPRCYKGSLLTPLHEMFHYVQPKLMGDVWGIWCGWGQWGRDVFFI